MTSPVGGHAQLREASRERLDDLRRVYERRSDEYIATTPDQVEGSMKVWMDATVRNLACDASILELGSGSGRDAAYFESLGFTVQRSDVARPFVERLRSMGHHAEIIDAVRDPFPMDLDVIFANAVVCHFEKDQFREFLRRARGSLKWEGTLSFSTKYGAKYKSSSPQDRLGDVREFSEWPTDELCDYLKMSGFDVEFLEVTGALRSSSRWINVVARRALPALF
ncbi:class I SAM-dependent methyltransferase [Agromyces binzhouensis]|uniref:class I SAM-dependent methyltransferase n=1 Tax=Agromyces binzhouensis TaxID=1817495 RepID=UPI00362EC250